MSKRRKPKYRRPKRPTKAHNPAAPPSSHSTQRSLADTPVGPVSNSMQSSSDPKTHPQDKNTSQPEPLSLRHEAGASPHCPKRRRRQRGSKVVNDKDTLTKSSHKAVTDSSEAQLREEPSTDKPVASDPITDQAQLFSRMTINSPPCYLMDRCPLEVRERIYECAFDDLPSSASYGHVDDDDDYFNDHLDDEDKVVKSCPGPLPPVCHASKQIRIEATLTYLRRTRIIFIAPGVRKICLPQQLVFVRWLEKFPENQAFLSIRELSYAPFIESNFDLKSYHHSFPSAGVILEEKRRHYHYSFTSSAILRGKMRFPEELVSRCTGLQSLHLEIDDVTVGLAAGLETDFTADPPCWRTLSQEELRNVCHRGYLEGYYSLFSLKNLRKLDLTINFTPRPRDESGTVVSEEEFLAPFVDMLRTGFMQRGGKICISIQAVSWRRDGARWTYLDI